MVDHNCSVFDSGAPDFSASSAELAKRLEQALAESKDLRRVHGPRSARKLHPLHRFVGNIFDQPGFDVRGLGRGDNKEVTLRSYVGKKNVDVSVRCGCMAAAVEVKNPLSNYTQNANNYIEGIGGQATFIQPTGIPYGYVLLLPFRLPYLTKDHIVKKMETLVDERIDYYRMLHKMPGDGSPTALLLCLIDYWSPTMARNTPIDWDGERNYVPTLVQDYQGLGFSAKNVKFLQEVGDPLRFREDLLTAMHSPLMMKRTREFAEVLRREET